MLKNGLYLVGKTLAGIVWLSAAVGLLLACDGDPGASPLLLYALLYLSVAVGVIAHECGHLLACLAVGAKVTAFQLGGESGWIRFRVRTVQVSLGPPFRGQVRYKGAESVGRRAMITLAGPITNVVFAGLVMWLAATDSRQSTRPFVVAVALGFGVTGLTSLIPMRSRSGRPSDGARLFGLRSGVRVAKASAARRTAAELSHRGRGAELVEWHARLDVSDRRMSDAEAAQLVMLEFSVVGLPGLPADAARLVESRVSMLLQRHDLSTARPPAYVALAMLQVRQGGRQALAEAERFCDQALAATQEVKEDAIRRFALALVIVSRQLRGLPYEDVRARAAATLSAASGDPEAIVPELRARLDPEGTLADFRNGLTDARQRVGWLAEMLRRQNRIGELLGLHSGLASPAGWYQPREVWSLHQIEWSLLLVPGLPRAVVDEAADRVRWILDNYPFEGEGKSLGRSAVTHTLALARLRQGRFGEVEPLCAAELTMDHSPDNRATVLATIAIARRALGQPYADQLREAKALSPDADLVAEAARDASDITAAAYL